MLLAELKTRSEQDAFLSLAYAVALADGCLGYAERSLISMYQEEMGVDSKHHLQQAAFIDACHVFTEQYIKKIVLINLFYLAYTDGYNSSKQKSILDAIRSELSINSAEVTQYEAEMSILKAPYFPNYLD